MYLNIIEYIDEEKQEELMEMIGVSEKVEGELARIRNEGIKQGINQGITQGINQGINQGKKSIIDRLLVNNSLEEVSKLLDISTTEILAILQK